MKGPTPSLAFKSPLPPTFPKRFDFDEIESKSSARTFDPKRHAAAVDVTPGWPTIHPEWRSPTQRFESVALITS